MVSVRCSLMDHCLFDRAKNPQNLCKWHWMMYGAETKSIQVKHDQYRKMKPADQKRVRDNFRRYNRMPIERRQELRDRFQDMSPDQRKRLRERMTDKPRATTRD